MQFKCKFKAFHTGIPPVQKAYLRPILGTVNSAFMSLAYEWTKLCFIFHQNKQVCCFVWPDESGSSCGPGECAFKWFLTRWRSIMPALWKSLRWAASAYAHYLWEHAASWLPFTKAGTQGQREWEWAMCMLTPSDETLLQLCIRVHFCVRGCLSMATCESLCVCACLPTQYPVLLDFIHWLPLLATDSNISPYFLLWQLANCCSFAWLAHCYTYGSRFIRPDCEVLCISSPALSAPLCRAVASRYAHWVMAF